VRGPAVAVGVAVLTVGLLSGCGDDGRTTPAAAPVAAHSTAPPAADAVRTERQPLTPAAEADAKAQLRPALHALHRVIRRKQVADSSVVLNALVAAGFSPDTLQVTRTSPGLSPGEIGVGIFVGEGCVVGHVSEAGAVLEPAGVIDGGGCLPGRATP
jgi:hypothetical protein